LSRKGGLPRPDIAVLARFGREQAKHVAAAQPKPCVAQGLQSGRQHLGTRFSEDSSPLRKLTDNARFALTDDPVRHPDGDYDQGSEDQYSPDQKMTMARRVAFRRAGEHVIEIA
jgi:hypothetical protein